MVCNFPVPSDLLLSVIIDLSKTDIKHMQNRTTPGSTLALKSTWAKLNRMNHAAKNFFFFGKVNGSGFKRPGSKMQTGLASSKDTTKDGKNGNSFHTYKDTDGSSGHSHFFTGTWMWLCIVLGSRERGQRTPPDMKHSKKILQTGRNASS